MTKNLFTFYTLTEDIIRKRLSRILKGKPLDTLTCQICKKSFRLGDQIVRRRRKFYHLVCFNRSIFDIDDDILTPQEKYFVEFGFYPDEQINTIPSSIPMQTIQMLS
jgi:hypothetical protein